MAPPKKASEKTLFDTLPKDQKDFFIASLEKKVRNVSKKLKEIKQLEIERKEGKELKEGQLLKITAKAEHLEKISEIESIASLYLEAKAENVEATSAAQNAPVVATANAVAQLYFAAQFASNTGLNNQLSDLFTRVFADTSAQRVDLATAELVAYLTGKRALVEAAVASTVSSEAFAQEQTAVVTQVVTVEVSAPLVSQVAQIVSIEFDEPIITQATEAEVDESAAKQVEQIIVDEPVEVTEQPVEQVDEQQQQQEETTAATEEPKQQERRGNAAGGRGNVGGRGTRGNREPRENVEGEQQEQQQQQQEGEKRAPRPPRTNNRPPRESGKTEVDNDGWNVVRKPPTHEGYKPRNAGGFNKENRTNGGEKKAYNPEYKKPYNKDRPTNQGGYVRRDKTETEAQTPAQNN